MRLFYVIQHRPEQFAEFVKFIRIGQAKVFRMIAKYLCKVLFYDSGGVFAVSIASTGKQGKGKSSHDDYLSWLG